MTQIQLTTREAVEIALNSIKGWIDADGHLFPDEAEKAKAAMKLLCDIYGFKLEQFFGVEEENSNRAQELSQAFYGFNGPEVTGNF